MANTVFFRRELCPAVGPIGFESQLDVYLRDTRESASSSLTLDKIATANVAVVEGMLVADFHLADTLFGEPGEISVDSLIARGVPDEGLGQSASLRLGAMVLVRRWPPAQ
jgi:hypothetical protein